MQALVGAIAVRGEQRLAFLLGIDEVAMQRVSVLAYSKLWHRDPACLQEDIAVTDLFVAVAAVEVRVVDVIDALDVHLASRSSPSSPATAAFRRRMPQTCWK